MAEGSVYPHDVLCRFNCVITIKPLEADEVPSLIEMYRSLNEQERMLLHRDVLDPYSVLQIKRDLEDDFVYRLLAWHKESGKVIGSIALFRGRAQWIRHTCQARIMTHPKYRRYGIATVLFDEVVPFARSKKIEKVYANLVPEQQAAIKMVKNIGFQREATFKSHVKDLYGRYHDMRIYSMDLEAAHKAMEDMIAGFTDYSG